MSRDSPEERDLKHINHIAESAFDVHRLSQIKFTCNISGVCNRSHLAGDISNFSQLNDKLSSCAKRNIFSRVLRLIPIRTCFAYHLLERIGEYLSVHICSIGFCHSCNLLIKESSDDSWVDTEEYLYSYLQRVSSLSVDCVGFSDQFRQWLYCPQLFENEICESDGSEASNDFCTCTPESPGPADLSTSTQSPEVTGSTGANTVTTLAKYLASCRDTASNISITTGAYQLFRDKLDNKIILHLNPGTSETSTPSRPNTPNDTDDTSNQRR